VPTSYLCADRLGRFVTDRGAEVDKRLAPAILRQARPKRVSEEIEPFVFVSTTSVFEAIERETSATTTLIHIVCDNVLTHKGKLVCAWLAKHPRFQFHFTPVHCSWMNQVEQWFSIL
jgi:hypothetical protein